MSKVQRLLFAAILGLSVAGLMATDDPESNAQGIDNPWALGAIATFVAVVALRALKKLRV